MPSLGRDKPYLAVAVNPPPVIANAPVVESGRPPIGADFGATYSEDAMKSSNPSLDTIRRAVTAAAVVLSIGATATLAQSSSSQGSSMSGGSDTSSSSSNMSNMSSNNSSDTRRNSDMSSSTSSEHHSDKLSWGDRRFVTKAADDGQEEVQLAQLATQKATNPEVKQFAQQMVDQHTQVNSQLLSLAESKNVKIDKEDNKEDRAYRRLNKASGSDFDREFVERMVDDHEKDIKLFEKAAKNAKDPEIRQFASSTLDHLRQHLTQVQQLQQSIVPTGREDSSSGRSGLSGSSSRSSSEINGRAATPGTTDSSDVSTGSAAGSSTSSTGSTR